MPAIPPLSIALVTLTTIFTARFVAASMPIDTKDEWGMLLFGLMAVAASLYVLAIGLAPVFRAGRRSPYLKLMFAANRTLSADNAGGALSWKDWFRQLRPWAVFIGALTYVVSIIAMLLVRKVMGKDRNTENGVRIGSSR